MIKEAFIKSFIFLSWFLVVTSCQDEFFTDKGFPEVHTIEASPLAGGGMSFKARIVSTGQSDSVEYGFIWGPSEGESYANFDYAKLGFIRKTGEYSYHALSTVANGGKYIVGAYLKTDKIISYGNFIEFSGNGSVPPELLSVNPSSGKFRDTIILKGRNFAFKLSSNQVHVNDKIANIVSASSEELKVVIPYLDEGDATITVSVKNATSTGSLNFHILAPEENYSWVGLNAFPGSKRTNAASFSINGKGYTGTGQISDMTVVNDFWEYNPATDQWVRKADYPYYLTNATGFSIGDYGYIGFGKELDFGSTDLTRYDPSSNTWQSMSAAQEPGSTMTSPAFIIGGIVYLAVLNNFQIYNHLTDIWVQESCDLDFLGNSVAFSLNGKGYTGIGRNPYKNKDENLFFEFNPLYGTLTRKSDFPGTPRNGAIYLDRKSVV